MDFVSNVKDALLWVKTNRRLGGYREHPALAAEAVAGGATCIVFCEKNFETEEFIEEALKVKMVCDKEDVPLIIEDNAIAAFIIDGAGVCVAADPELLENARKVLGDKKIITAVVNKAHQAEAAQGLADYLVVNPEQIPAIKESTVTPIIACGGIHAANIREAAQAGAEKIMVMHAAMVSGDITAACKKLVTQVKAAYV